MLSAAFFNSLNAQDSLSSLADSASDSIISGIDLNLMITQIKNADDLYDLNVLRSGLRNITYGSLKSREEKKDYAEAHRQLAIAYRSNRFIRPGFDVYKKYIELRDSVFAEEKNREVQEIKNRHNILTGSISKEIEASKKEESQLFSDKAYLAAFRNNTLNYALVATAALLIFFLLGLFTINRKIDTSRTLHLSNQEKILLMQNGITAGQMGAALMNQLSGILMLMQTKIYESEEFFSKAEFEIKKLKNAEDFIISKEENFVKLKNAVENCSKSVNGLLRNITFYREQS